MSRLNDLIRQGLRSNILGASAFAESVRQDVADELEVALIAASGGDQHIVRIQGDGWTCQHPLGERFEGDLFECKVTPLIPLQMSAATDGEYAVWSRDGELHWASVVDAPDEGTQQ